MTNEQALEIARIRLDQASEARFSASDKDWDHADMIYQQRGKEWESAVLAANA